MAAKALIANGELLTRDYGIQAGISAAIEAGVQKNLFNECEVTLNQVDTGLVFVEVTRTTVAPNETFLVPVLITAPHVVNTSGTGWVIVRIDTDKLNGESAGADGSDAVVIEEVAALPAGNYEILATLAAGTITDARSYTKLSEYILREVFHYDEDAEATDDYVISINGVKAYEDGMELKFKANTANTGTATLDVNGIGAKAIKIRTDADLTSDDIKAGSIVTVVYDADNDWWQMLSASNDLPAVPLKANEAEAEAGTDDTKYMTPLKTREAVDALGRAPEFTFGENIDGTASVPLAAYISDGTGGRNAGQVYKADSGDTANAAGYFHGFVIDNVLATNTGKIVTDGVVGGFVGLTEGRMYYVDTTAGAITLTNTGIPIGVAVSATEILIQKGLQKRKRVAFQSGAVNETTSSRTFSLPFRPRAIILHGNIYALRGPATNLAFLTFSAEFDGSAFSGQGATQLNDPSTTDSVVAISDDATFEVVDVSNGSRTRVQNAALNANSFTVDIVNVDLTGSGATGGFDMGIIAIG